MGGMTILWIAVLVIAVIIEAATMGLTCIWFAGGAFVALILEKLGCAIYLQMIVFLIVSLVLMYFTRPVALKHFNKERVKTNVNELIGQKAVVTDTICNLKGTGKAVVKGLEWSAQSISDRLEFSEGEIVRIVDIRGVKLIVEPEKTTENES